MKRITTVADRLKEYRELQGMTYAELSERTGLPAQTLNRYELGQRIPKIDVAVGLAESLGVNPLWMQGYDVPIEPETKNKPAGPELDELDAELLRLAAQLTPEQKQRQIEMLRDIVGRQDT